MIRQRGYITKDSRGFTLVEVLVAIVVFALGVLALNKVQMSTINSNTYSNQMSLATSLAHDQMDTLMSLAYTHADLNAGNHSTTAAMPLVTYTIAWTVVDNTPLTGTKTITITVQWNFKNANHSVIFSCAKGTSY